MSAPTFSTSPCPPGDARPWDASVLLGRAREMGARYASQIRGLPYERKGVLFSEMLFLLAGLGTPPPGRIVECGRARGQSTSILGTCLPDCEVLTIERDATGPDAEVASARLRALRNVQTVYGDANAELPRLLQPGDAAFIDGPKGWHAVRLALHVLDRCRPRAVFLHDCYRGQGVRRFLERHVPGTLFSDDPRFVQEWAHLDAPCWTAEPDPGGEEAWRPYRFQGRRMASYGPTLGLLPWLPRADYRALERRRARHALASRLSRSLGKRLGRR